MASSSHANLRRAGETSGQWASHLAARRQRTRGRVSWLWPGPSQMCNSQSTSGSHANPFYCSGSLPSALWRRARANQRRLLGYQCAPSMATASAKVKPLEFSRANDRCRPRFNRLSPSRKFKRLSSSIRHRRACKCTSTVAAASSSASSSSCSQAGRLTLRQFTCCIQSTRTPSSRVHKHAPAYLKPSTSGQP